MKHYLINDFECIDNNMKICYYELLDEDDYRLYIYAKLHLKKLEVWAAYADFDVLQFEPVEISDIEYSILDKHEPKGCYHVLTYLIQYLIDNAEDLDIQLPEYISQITNEQLMQVIDELAQNQREYRTFNS